MRTIFEDNIWGKYIDIYYMIYTKKGKIKTNEINGNNIIPKKQKGKKKSKLLILF